MKHARRNLWGAEGIGSNISESHRPDVDEVFQSGTPVTPPNPIPARKNTIISLVVGAVIFVLLGRLLFLQSQQGNVYRQVVEKNRYRYVRIPAPRGMINDRFGKPVVENQPDFMLTVIPALVPKRDPARSGYFNSLSSISKQTPTEIEKLLNNKKYSANEPVPILNHISYDEALKMSVDTAEIPGSSVEAVPKRQYIYGESMAHILGYIGQVSDEDLKKDPELTMVDVIGKTGLEQKYNNELTGEDGYVVYEHDILNRLTSPVKQIDTKPGQTVKLSIDAELQDFIYARLSQAVKSAHSTGGAAIALNPQNGDILAITSYPSYDSNWFNNKNDQGKIQNALTNPAKLFVNRAITGLYPSGSIIKPIISVAALAEHIITPQTTVMSTGGLKVGPNFFPDWKSGGHGLTNLYKALAESVNTFFYEIGGGYQQQPGLGVERIVKYLSLFGWGKKTGIDLPNEASGFLPTKEWRDEKRVSPWRLGDTYHLAIGQGDLEVTPLQVANGIAAIANGGTLYQPRLVTEISDVNGRVIKSVPPKVIAKNLANQTYLNEVQQGMRQGVISGSSRAMQDLPVAVAGKTGTAQYGNQGKTHAWYATYAPYDHPEIVMVVIVEGGGEGNATALPVAHDTLKWYYTVHKNH